MLYDVKHYMPKANHLIVKPRKYFSIMQFVCLNYFFLSEKSLVGFSVVWQIFGYSRSFKSSKIFQGLSVTQRLSPSHSRLTEVSLCERFSIHFSHFVAEMPERRFFVELF